MTVLITGAAGFIGFHLSKRLLAMGTPVIGIDNFNDYYDPKLKKARFSHIESCAAESGTPFTMVRAALEDSESLTNTFKTYKPDKVVNLAAQAGVRRRSDPCKVGAG